MRLGLLMRRMALDWTLSRRQGVDFEAPPQTWEQYSKEGRIWDLYIFSWSRFAKGPLIRKVNHKIGLPRKA